MNRLGILGAYLPEFERVVGQMQFDLFHIYTVDAHTLQVVRNMRRFRYKINDNSFQSPRIYTSDYRELSYSTSPVFSRSCKGHGRRSLHHGHRHCKIIL